MLDKVVNFASKYAKMNTAQFLSQEWNKCKLCRLGYAYWTEKIQEKTIFTAKHTKTNVRNTGFSHRYTGNRNIPVKCSLQREF